MKSDLDLSHLNYAVLALGSQEYPDSYCSFGHEVNHWLKRSGAHPLFDVIEINNGSNEDIQRWNQALARATRLDLSNMNIEKYLTSGYWISASCLIRAAWVVRPIMSS